MVQKLSQMKSKPGFTKFMAFSFYVCVQVLAVNFIEEKYLEVIMQL